MTDRLIRRAEVLQQVGIGRQRLYALVAKGEFPPPVHLGRSVRWSEREVQTWILERLDERRSA